MSTGGASEVEDLRRANDELSRRLVELEGLEALRRAVRGDDDAERIAERAAPHVVTLTGARRAAVLVEDAATGAWAATIDGERIEIERTDALVSKLESTPALTLDPHADASTRAAFGKVLSAIGGAIVVRPLIGSGDTPGLVGLLAAADVDPRRGRVLDELAAELAFALSSAIRNRARTEELAMLAVQERELVGLLRDVENRDAMIRADLEQARAFQMFMLGPKPRVKGVRIETMFEPLAVVGGDLFAFSDLGDVLRVFIADATGHGVRASLTTMLIKNGYESATHDAESPAVLLQRLNDAIARYKTPEMLFTAACIDLEPATGIVRIASAAHPPACIVRADRIDTVEGGVTALMGLHNGMRFEETSNRVEEGESIFLFTDGIADTHNEEGELFGEARLYAALRAALTNGTSCAAAVRFAMKTFAGTRDLTDDATLVGLTRDGDAAPASSKRDPAAS